MVIQQLRLKSPATYYQNALSDDTDSDIDSAIDSVLERYSQIAEMRYKLESRQLEYLSCRPHMQRNRLEMADLKSEIERLQIDLMSQLNTQEPVKPAERISRPSQSVNHTYDYQQSSLPTVSTSRISSSLSIKPGSKTGFVPSLSLSVVHHVSFPVESIT